MKERSPAGKNVARHFAAIVQGKGTAWHSLIPEISVSVLPERTFVTGQPFFLSLQQARRHLHFAQVVATAAERKARQVRTIQTIEISCGSLSRANEEVNSTVSHVHSCD